MKTLEWNQMEMLEGGKNCLRAAGVNAAVGLMFGGYVGALIGGVGAYIACESSDDACWIAGACPIK